MTAIACQSQTDYGLSRDPRAAVSVLFATSVVPVVMLLALSIDLGAATSAKSRLDLAANASALQGLRVATQEFIRNGSSNAATNGSTAAQEWWTANTARVNATVTSNSASVTQSGVSFTANVSYAANVGSTFSGVFGVNNLPISGRVSSTMQLNAYVDVDMLIDNSSSMLIAATSSGVTSMESFTPCFVPGNYGPGTGPSVTNGSGQNGGAAATTTNCPAGTSVGAGYSAIGVGNPYLANSTLLSKYLALGTGFKQVSGQSYGTTAGTGSSYSSTWGYIDTTTKDSNNNPQSRFYPFNTSLVCGFACHWDGTATPVTPSALTPPPWDFYSLAKSKSIQLRLDVVQNAAAQVIQAMIVKQAQTGVANQFGTGIYLFNTNFTRVYPSSGESSTDLSSALAAVQGIQTPVVANDGDTFFPTAMSTLATTLTNAGDGSSTTNRIKNLFIITDGIQDYPPRTKGSSLGPIQASDCTQIKSKGINVWVLYTTYTPLPNNGFYNTNIKPYVESPPTPATVVTNLQACASSPSQFYQANDPASITNAMQTMLTAAASQPGRITQ